MRKHQVIFAMATLAVFGAASAYAGGYYIFHCNKNHTMQDTFYSAKSCLAALHEHNNAYHGGKYQGPGGCRWVK